MNCCEHMEECGYWPCVLVNIQPSVLAGSDINPNVIFATCFYQLQDIPMPAWPLCIFFKDPLYDKDCADT